MHLIPSSRSECQQVTSKGVRRNLSTGFGLQLFSRSHIRSCQLSLSCCKMTAQHGAIHAMLQILCRSEKCVTDCQDVNTHIADAVNVPGQPRYVGQPVLGSVMRIWTDCCVKIKPKQIASCR